MQIHIPFHWTVRPPIGRYPRACNTVFGSVNDGDRLTRKDTAYYRSLLPLREHYVIAPFETVIMDVGRVIDAVNRRFGTTFSEIDADRHLALNQKFLAQEKFDALQARETTETPDRAPQFDRYSHLLKRAEAEHAQFLALAADDGTARPANNA